MQRIFVLCLTILSCFGSVAQRQTKDLGVPLITNYSPKDYSGFYQNWGFVQDSLGMLYIANGDGIMTYDGVRWSMLALPNNGASFALGKAKDGTIYVGGNQELGYLKTNTIGQLDYESLTPFLKEADLDYKYAMEVYGTSDGVFFGCNDKILFWDGKQFKSWNGSYSKIFKSRDEIYVGKLDQGLMKFADGDFKLIPNGEFFKDNPVTFVAPYGMKNILVGTQNGLFKSNGNVFKTFGNRNNFFINNRVYGAIKLNDGNYAINSLRKGILIIDNQGNEIANFSDKRYIRDTGVLSLYQDRSGILWAGLNDGIAKIEYALPFTKYTGLHNLDKKVMRIIKADGTLLVGTREGLLFYNDEIAQPKFEMFAEVTGSMFDIVETNNDVLVAGTRLFKVDKNAVETIDNILNVYCLTQSVAKSNRVFVGHASGITSIIKKNDTWEIEKHFNKINFQSHKIIELVNGDLWVWDNTAKLRRIKFETDKVPPEIKEIKSYDSNYGLPDGISRPRLIDGNIYYSPKKGAFHYSRNLDRFVRDTILATKFGFKNKSINIKLNDYYGNVFFSITEDESKRFVALKNKNGSYTVNALNQERIQSTIRNNGAFYDKEQNFILYPDREKGIIVHDLNKNKSIEKRNFNARISNVTYQQDSLIFGGYSVSNSLVLPFKNNQFRFQYGSTNYYDESQNKFQYFLDGFDESWSEWTSETQKDYTNIPEGDYTFRVRAKNIFNKISTDDSYHFSILPPWYRTWWMYAFYVLAAIAVFHLFSKWRSRRLRLKNVTLENIVNARTEEIKKKNIQLENQAHKLKELDTMKTRLFANISHEFRTPLTLIKAPIETLEDTGQNTITTSNIKMIRRNANRLLNLVNQLLDLSKLDSGKLVLNPTEGDVFRCVRAAASSFASHAAQRHIDYQVKIPSAVLWTNFDRDKLEKILYNLLSNAFKFTNDHGKIVLNVKHEEEHLQFSISDSGRGIPEDKLPYIFNRFFQVDDSYTKEKSGSGIGLALTKELVQLMHGEIQVESHLDNGTTFMVRILLEEIISGYKKEDAKDSKSFINQFEDETLETTAFETGKTERILIIEDNNDMRLFIADQMKDIYNVLQASNGKSGLEIASKQFPDLIITDLMMPQMDGMELCGKLKTNIATSHIPVIMLTAKAGLDNKIQGLETGADDYLTKPFNVSELRVRIKNLLENRQRLRKQFGKNIDITPKKITVTSLDERFLEETMLLIEGKFSNPQFNVPEMQKALGMSKTQLHRKLKALTDHPPGELLRNFRLQRAKQLLEQEGDNISQIAYSVGFNSASYFTRCFRDYFGKSPSSYKTN